jgi:hypothetical protein
MKPSKPSARQAKQTNAPGGALWTGDEVAPGVKQFPLIESVTKPKVLKGKPKPVFLPPGRSATPTPRVMDCPEQSPLVEVVLKLWSGV